MHLNIIIIDDVLTQSQYKNIKNSLIIRILIVLLLQTNLTKKISYFYEFLNSFSSTTFFFSILIFFYLNERYLSP